MKKLFTIALAFLVATMGYSQVKKVSKNDAKNKIATIQVAKDSENFENVQRRPAKTRSDGELDYTYYDWQTIAGPRNWTIVWPDGKVNFAYNHDLSLNTSFSDSGTGIGTYDSENDEWIPLEGRIEPVKTTFGSIARYQENSIVVAANNINSNSICLFIVDDKDNMTPLHAFPISYLDPSYEPSCPNVMTSGANRDIIHVVATANSVYGVPGAENVINPIIYFRSMDGGETWDKENVILPFMGPEYGVAWGSHVCYWMETTEDNCLALVVNNPWSDGMVIYSYDDGETWERKVFYHHPGINTTFDSWFMYPRWVSAQWGIDGELCIAYEFNCTTGEPGSDNYNPGVGGVAFWSESLPFRGEENPGYGFDPTNPMPPTPGQPFIMDSAYLHNLYASWNITWPTQETWPEFIGYPLPEHDSISGFNIADLSLHGDYHCGPVTMPVLAMVPSSDSSKMVAVWCSMDENNMDVNGNYYFKLFGSYSSDGGCTWTPQIQLTTDFMWELNEFVYPQATVIGTTLVVAVQTDDKTGSSFMNDDPYPSDSWYQGFTFDLDEIFPRRSEWYYEIEWDNGSITYQHLECVGDTLFDRGKRPKVIVRSNTHYDRDAIIEVTHEYVYIENDTVYWWNRELQEFTILYDLSANVGDEWEIKVGTESLTMHVDAVENIEYEGRIYRMLRVSDPEDLFSGNIVCGIGHLTSFFPEKLMNQGKDFRVEGMRCYWIESDLIFKIGDEDCDAIYGDLHDLEEDGSSTGLRALSVYPNPANGNLFVESRLISSLPGLTYRITNLLGQTLLQGHITVEIQQIDINNLPSGMYFISMGEQTVKFVVK